MIANLPLALAWISPDSDWYISFISLSIISACLISGFLYSCLVLYTNAFATWRVQAKPYRKSVFLQRLPLITFNVLLIYLLSGVGLYISSGMFVIETPSLLTFISQFLIIVLFDDMFFYFYHRLLHENTYLKQKIHSIHHRASHPFPLEFIYVHPLEWMIGYVGAVVGVLLILFFGSINAYAFWTYIVFRMWHEIDIHSGVKSLFVQYIPFIAPAEHHDLHHSSNKGNYASTLVIWDKICNTCITPSKHQQ